MNSSKANSNHLGHFENSSLSKILKKRRHISEFKAAVHNAEVQMKISEALKCQTMARDRTRIRQCKSLESSKFSSWSSYTKGEKSLNF